MTNMHLKLAIAATATVLAAGCAAPPTYVREGTQPVSVVDLREAKQTVRIYDTIPDGATAIVDVETIRCHRTAGHPKPTEDTVRDDLLVEALGKSKNGIAEISIEEGSLSFSYNCWTSLHGKAKAFTTR